MAVDRKRIGRGALAGAVAAAVWAAQQPLDKRLLGAELDDVRLLGRLLRAGRLEYPVGLAAHVANGAAFGAAYSRFGGALGALPPAARGPAAALAEHLASWPATRLVEPALTRSPRAFALATWRHLLFGAVLGELERRWNEPEGEPQPIDPLVAASNGHGAAEHLVPTTPA